MIIHTHFHSYSTFLCVVSHALMLIILSALSDKHARIT